MERITLTELGFKSRAEALIFLKKIWAQEKTACPICGAELALLHKKAKKSDCDWQCKNCGKIYKTIRLLDEINAHLPGYPFPVS